MNKGVWQAFRAAGRALPSRESRDRLLGYAGPILLVLTAGLWLSLLTLGVALVVWPALGSGVQASQGPTPTTFATALYFSGYSLTTLGTGDIVPKTAFYQLLMVGEAAAGFSALTLTLTYFLSVYGALVRRNTFALTLHHRTAGTGDAAEFLARLGPAGDFTGAREDLATLSRDVLNLLESHHSYPVLHYFRFGKPYYALSTMALVVMDTATLIRSALDERANRNFVDSAAATALWGSGLHLLTELSETFLPGGAPRTAKEAGHSQRSEQRQPGNRDEPEQWPEEHAWRERYRLALGRLQAAGITTVADEEDGADRYVALRREWHSYVAAFADYMLYDRSEIAPVRDRK